MTTINQAEDLRSKIFGICENLYKNNEKVTREAVREHLGGGSFSTISPVVSEWKKVKKVQFEEKEGTNSQIINAESSEIIEILKELKTALINTEFITDKEIENIIRSGAEKAAGLIIAQEAATTYFYQNLSCVTSGNILLTPTLIFDISRFKKTGQQGNWLLISGEFVADGSENIISIGRFPKKGNKNISTRIFHYKPSKQQLIEKFCSADYYLDNFSLLLND
jgi:hypothetical protein